VPGVDILGFFFACQIAGLREFWVKSGDLRPKIAGKIGSAQLQGAENRKE
jgi:hypothetical protein